MPTPQIFTFDQLRAFIDNQLPDNTSGLVDPADVRTALRSFVDIQSLRNDMMAANLSPEQAAAWNALITKLEEIQRNADSGIKGVATQTNAPTDWVTGDTYLFEKWAVNAPITSPNNWGGIAVTDDELKDNLVFFNVTNGVVEKQLVPVKSAYDVAVINGFVGSEAQWVDSLKANGAEWGLGATYEFVDDNSFNDGNTGANSTGEVMFIKEIADVGLTKITSVGDNFIPNDAQYFFLIQYRPNGSNYEKIAQVQMSTDKTFDLSGFTLQVGDWLAINNTAAVGSFQYKADATGYKYYAKSSPTQNIDTVAQSPMTAYPYVYSLIWEYTRNGVANVPDYVQEKIQEKTVKNIPLLYNIEVDEAGNAINFYKTWQPEPQNEIHTLKDDFAPSKIVAMGDGGYVAFPGLAIGKTGVIHVVYRRGGGHVSIDGSILYKYSTDFGKTWSAPITLLAGGTQIGDWYQDFRDCRLLRMSNGKYLFGTFSLQVKPEAGQGHAFDMAINTDPTSRKVHNVILEEDTNGILNIATKTVVNHLLTDRFTGGGLKEHKKIIYQMCYKEVATDVYDAFITKSLDFGLTWSDVATVQTGCSESSIAFVGETLYCLLRPSTLSTSVLKKSTDYGVTWTLVSETVTYHGLDLISLAENLLVSGRQPPNFTTVEIYNTSGESLIKPIIFNGEEQDSGYSQICFFEQYIFIVYYNVLGAKVLIQLTNIEKSKLLNIK